MEESDADLEQDTEEVSAVDSKKVILTFGHLSFTFVWQSKVMTVAFSSKVVEKHKKVSNKKVLTGRLVRKKMKQNKKLSKSGKYLYVYILY